MRNQYENLDSHAETLADRYAIYLSCADDGNGGDITRPGQPLKTFEEWLDS